jgi:hypothetical protein
MRRRKGGDPKIPSGGEASLQTLKKDKGGKGDGGMQLRVMDGIDNEVR